MKTIVLWIGALLSLPFVVVGFIVGFIGHGITIGWYTYRDAAKAVIYDK